MQSTMAVEAHASATCPMDMAAARWPSPSPPTSFALISPSSPARPSASIPARGKAPVASISAAAGAITSLITVRRASVYEGAASPVETFVLCASSTVAIDLFLLHVLLKIRAPARGSRASKERPEPYPVAENRLVYHAKLYR